MNQGPRLRIHEALGYAYYLASDGAGVAGCSVGLVSFLSGSFSVIIYCEFGTLDCSCFLKVANTDIIMSFRKKLLLAI